MPVEAHGLDQPCFCRAKATKIWPSIPSATPPKASVTTTPLKGLNDAQSQAVQHIDGPLLIIAGPGSGKTRVIVHRIAYLVNTVGISPARICAVTFTNKAARQLKDRLADLLGPDRGARVVAGTFHAQCARMLRQHGDVIGLDRAFTIYDRDDQIDVLKEAFAQIDLDPKRFSLRGVLDGISGAKAQLLDPDGYRAHAGSYFEEVVAKVYAAYQQVLARNQAVDFDDLLLRTYHLLRDHDDMSASATRTASSTSSSTSSRTRTRPSTPSPVSSRASGTTSASSATPTSPSTPGATPTYATSSASSATTPARTS